MLNRIFVALAIIASIFVAAFGLLTLKPKIDTVITQRNDERDGRLKAERERDQTRRTLQQTQERLKQTQDQLETTRQEKAAALAEVGKQRARGDQLQEELNKVRGERDEARGELAAWKALGLSVDQIAGLIKQLKDTIADRDARIEENRLLSRKLNQVQSKLDEILKPDYHVPLPEGLRGKVVAVDPKWDFVVLDFGEDSGALEHGELLVDRNGQLIAKLRIESVQQDRTIANVMSGWSLQDVVEGDIVFPVHTD